jgi:hypothetical protein
MKNNVAKSPKSDEFQIRVRNGSGGCTVVVVRNTFERLKLDGHDYFRYQIVQPKGYENEDIVHRLDRGYEGLLASVFVALAEAPPRA